MGLSCIIQDVMQLNPFEKNLYVFCNKARNSLKVVYWDKNGMAMWHKKLQKEKFKWPGHLGEDSLLIKKKELESFLKGLDPWQITFKKLNYKKV
jgi:transposase